MVLRERPETDERGQPTELVIRQAQGWVKAADGTIILTAEAPKVTPQSPRLVHPGCQLLTGTSVTSQKAWVRSPPKSQAKDREAVSASVPRLLAF